MKVSIITVVYNNEKTIEKAIQSVLSQSYKNLEYIIIDGNSTDNTKNIIERYATEVAVYLTEPDKGIYDAMNKGISLATGDVIGILNSDDIYQDSEVIKDVATVFQDNSQLDILYGNIVYVKSDNTEKVVRKWKTSEYYPNFFDHANVPPHPGLFAKSIVYKTAGLFDLRYKLSSDYEFMLRIFKKHNFSSKYYDRLIIKMRLGGATNKNFSNIIQGNREIVAAWKNNGLRIPFFFMPLKIIKRFIQFI